MKTRLYNLLEKNKIVFVYTPFVVYWVFLFMMTSIPDTGLPAIGIWDKFEHFAGYLTLAFIGGLTFHFQNKLLYIKKNLYTSVIILFCVYGIVDEVHQFFIPGRYFDWMDLIANFIGICAGVLILKTFIQQE